MKTPIATWQKFRAGEPACFIASRANRTLLTRCGIRYHEATAAPRERGGKKCERCLKPKS